MGTVTVTAADLIMTAFPGEESTIRHTKTGVASDDGYIG